MDTTIAVDNRVAQIADAYDRRVAEYGKVPPDIYSDTLYEGITEIFAESAPELPHELFQSVRDSLRDKRIGAAYYAKSVVACYLSQSDVLSQNWAYVVASIMGYTDDWGKPKLPKLPKLGSVTEGKIRSLMFGIVSSEEYRPDLQKLYSDGTYACASDGFRFAKLPTTLAHGMYVQNGKSEPIRYDASNFWTKTVPHFWDAKTSNLSDGTTYYLSADTIAELLSEAQMIVKVCNYVYTLRRFAKIPYDIERIAEANFMQIEDQYWNARYVVDFLTLALHVVTGPEGHTQVTINMRGDVNAVVASHQDRPFYILMPVKGPIVGAPVSNLSDRTAHHWA